MRRDGITCRTIDASWFFTYCKLSANRRSHKVEKRVCFQNFFFLNQPVGHYLFNGGTQMHTYLFGYNLAYFVCHKDAKDPPSFFIYPCKMQSDSFSSASKCCLCFDFLFCSILSVSELTVSNTVSETSCCHLKREKCSHTDNTM